jgi:hypothetical protein
MSGVILWKSCGNADCAQFRNGVGKRPETTKDTKLHEDNIACCAEGA